jgi:hypothetical protein
VVGKDEGDRERMRVAGTIEDSRRRLFSHPFAEVTMQFGARGPAALEPARPAEADALLVAEADAGIASPPSRADTSPRHAAESAGERRIEPALVFAPSRRREGPRPYVIRERQPTVQVEPGSLLRQTAFAIRPPRQPAPRKPVLAPRTRAPGPLRTIATAALCLSMVLVAGLVAFGGDDPLPVASPRVSTVVPARVRGRERRSAPTPLRPVAAADVSLPPVPGATPPVAPATALAPTQHAAPTAIPAMASAPRGRATVDLADPDGADTPPPVPAPESASPKHCELTRRAAADARGAHDWAGLLRHTARASCWRASDERVALRVKALMELGRFDECARLGTRVARPLPDVRQWTRVCARRSGTAT